MASGKVTPWGWLLLLAALALFGVLLAIWAVFDNFRLSRLSEPAAAVEIYRRMRRRGARLMLSMEMGDTPNEFAVTLIARLQELVLLGGNPAFGLRVSQEVKAITAGIVLASYCPSLSGSDLDEPLFRQWQRLKWQLDWMWFLEKWTYLRERLLSSLTGVVERGDIG